jgi:hypothetical protein
MTSTITGVKEMPSKIIPQEHRDEMIRMYQEGNTMSKAAAAFGYTYGACSFALKQAGVLSRSRSQAHRRYSVNEDFFAVVDTEEKAYWLGFLAADGHIGENGHIKVALSAKDKGHIYKFAETIESEHPIKIRKQNLDGNIYEVATIIVCSSKMVNDLILLGIGPRKSFIVTPSDVPIELSRHYWRGVFDGDGNIYIGTHRKFAVRLLGTQAMINGFRSFLLHSGIETDAQDRSRGNVVEISIGGVTLCKKILGLLYNDATIFLHRKKKLADRLLSKKRLHKDWSVLTTSQLRDLRYKLGTWKKVATHLGTDEGTLYGIRKRLNMSPDWTASA